MILLPTRRRLSLLERFLKSVDDTQATCGGLVLVDETDYKDNQEKYEALKMPYHWSIKITKGESMGDKTRESFSEVKHRDWVGILNDDHVCLTKKWDEIANRLMDGTNMLSTNDGSWQFGVKVVGLTAWSMPLLDVVGFPIFPRNLQHLYIDDVWKNIGVQTGCWHETMQIDIAHKHALKGEMDQDDTFKKVYAPTSWEYDAKEFKNFMEQDFPIVCERVIKFREGASIKAKFV